MEPPGNEWRDIPRSAALSWGARRAALKLSERRGARLNLGLSSNGTGRGWGGARILEEAPPPRSPRAWGLTGLPRAPRWRLRAQGTEPEEETARSKSPDSRPLGAPAWRASPPGRWSEVGKGRQPCSTDRPEDAALGQCGQRRRPERARHTEPPAGETTCVGAAQHPGQETRCSCLCHQLQAGARSLKGGRLPALAAAGSLSQATSQSLTPFCPLVSAGLTEELSSFCWKISQRRMRLSERTRPNEATAALGRVCLI